jgi:hypothetical protein
MILIDERQLLFAQHRNIGEIFGVRHQRNVFEAIIWQITESMSCFLLNNNLFVLWRW